MKYHLRKTDFVLINGAIAFGNTLKTMPEATKKDIANIEKVQDVLRRLPEYTPNIEASYGFNVGSHDVNSLCVNRGWHVYIEGRFDGRIEIGSYYNTADRNEDLERSKEFNFFFDLKYSFPFPKKIYLEWIEEVKNPNQYRKPGQYFELDTHLRIFRKVEQNV